MKNRLETEHTAGTFASWLLAALLALHFLWFPASWLGSAVGMPWGNLMSVEGIRWYSSHMQDILCTPALAYVIPLIVLVGAVERSGVWEMLRDGFSANRFHLTYRQRRALGFSDYFCFSWLRSFCLSWGLCLCCLASRGRSILPLSLLRFIKVSRWG